MQLPPNGRAFSEHTENKVHHDQVWSPDSAKIALVDHAMTIHLVDLSADAPAPSPIATRTNDPSMGKVSRSCTPLSMRSKPSAGCLQLPARVGGQGRGAAEVFPGLGVAALPPGGVDVVTLAAVAAFAVVVGGGVGGDGGIVGVIGGGVVVVVVVLLLLLLLLLCCTLNIAALPPGGLELCRPHRHALRSQSREPSEPGGSTVSRSDSNRSMLTHPAQREAVL